MDINKLVEKLNNELDKLNQANNIDTNSFFTSNEQYNDDLNIDEISSTEEKSNNFYDEEFKGNFELETDKYEDIEPDNETKDLVTTKEHRLLTAQTMFKKSIRISLKSFLISLSLSFLNLFI